MAYIHHKYPALNIKAGAAALAHIQKNGLNAHDIDIIPGAAGGPKGIGLCGLDQAIFSEFLPQHHKKRWLVGASIGSWRFAAIAAHGGKDGPSKLAQLYTNMSFYKNMPTTEVSEQCRQTLSTLLEGQHEQIIKHPDYQLSVVMARSKHLLASDHKFALGAALLAVIGSNAIYRPTLNLFMQRSIAYPNAQQKHFPAHIERYFDTEHVTLNQHNLMNALMASGSIPFAMSSVQDVSSNSQNSYRDGGLIDYHLDLPYASEGLVLYPHFSHQITPSWFDKALPWRKANPQHQKKTILISPSAHYLKNLPLGRLPDRSDFLNFAGRDDERKKHWQQSIAESQRMGDEFLELAQSDDIAAHIKPL